MLDKVRALDRAADAGTLAVDIVRVHARLHILIGTDRNRQSLRCDAKCRWSILKLVELIYNVRLGPHALWTKLLACIEILRAGVKKDAYFRRQATGIDALARPNTPMPSPRRKSSADAPRPARLNSWALTAKLGKASTLPELLALQEKHGDRFDRFSLGAFWSKFKRLPRGELDALRDRLAPVCEQTVRMLPEVTAREVANIAHAFAKAKLVGSCPWESVWAALPEAVRLKLGSFDEQELSNTAWAFVAAGHATPELSNAISAEVVRRQLGGFREIALSSTAWAFATAGHASAELFKAIAAEAVRRGLGGFNEQNLSNTAWAFAKAGHASPELFNAMSAEAVRGRLGVFKEQELSNMAWAFAAAGHASPALFNAISAEAVRRQLGGFNPQDLANTAWAFATAGHASRELFNAISAEAVRRRLSGFTPQNLSNTAWAFATAGHASPALFKALAAEAVRRGLGGFNEQNLSNTAWAFAVLNPPSVAELFGPATFTTRCAHLETSFSRKSLAQLHQWSLWRKERGARWPALPRSLQQACRDAFVTQGEKSSQFQRNVVEEIRSRGANVQEEHRCEISGYSIDALVTLNDGRQIAVEVDGPLHFWGHSRQPTGATLLKQRQLRHFGWRLESVPFWRWNHTKELHWLPIMS